MSSKIEKIAMFLSDRYGVDVQIRPFDDEVEIGALSGKKILVNKDARNEVDQLFVIAHLFGHMVQFSNYDQYKYLAEEVEKPKPLTLSEDFKKSFYNYELEGYKIGKKLLEEVLGVEETSALDERFQIYFETDFELFIDYLTTGDQVSIIEFNNILQKRYKDWKGRYTKKLETIDLPEKVDPKKDAIVY